MDGDPTPTPGSTAIRPTRAKAEKDLDAFYALLEAFRDPQLLPLRKIAEICGDASLNPEPNTLRRIKNRSLSDESRASLLRHIFDEERLVSGRARRQLETIDDTLYFALLNYLESSECLSGNILNRMNRM